MTERWWLIPVTVTEYGREVRVRATSKREAIRKLRACSWDEMSDADDTLTKVTKVGAVRPEDE